MGVIKKNTNLLLHLSLLTALLVLSLVPTVHAAQSSSPNYQVNEVFFGNGGELNACSSNFCAKESLGETAVGKSSSPNYQSFAGFNSDRNPSLTFIVPSQLVNFGVQTPGSTSTATATFSVKSYLTSGYVVQTVGAGLKNAGYTLHNMSTTGASDNTSEQFGINLVANTSPSITGSADPGQSPDATFGFGIAAPGYDTANQFTYNDGDIIAKSLKSSGTTNYTISYILNTTHLTPGGTYTFNQVLVATATY